MPKMRDLTNVRIGRLVAISPVRTTLASGRKVYSWVCKCDCGNEITALTSNLTRPNHTTSCGCYRWEAVTAANSTHGATLTRGGQKRWPEYSVWNEMRRRCHVETSGRYSYYGARGITVCDRWRFGEDGKSGFECFISDMGRRPAKGLSIDRINNDGNYEPDNCRWATQSEQTRNRRKLKRKVRVITHCTNGHELAVAGFYIEGRSGKKICKVCQKFRVQRYLQSKASKSEQRLTQGAGDKTPDRPVIPQPKMGATKTIGDCN